MPTTTVTSADHRNHAIARDISTGYTFTRTPGSKAFIEGVHTKLKKYKSPIQMIPKITCSQRSAINSFAAAFARKLKCGFHSGNDASTPKPMRLPPLQIVDVNLQIEPPALILKRSRAEFRRPHVAHAPHHPPGFCFCPFTVWQKSVRGSRAWLHRGTAA